MRKLTSSLIISAIVLLMVIIPPAPTQAQSQFQPGDVIVAEQGRNRLVVVHPDGAIEQIIANLQDPRGVAIEADGSILVVEQSGHRVSRVRFSNNRFTRATVRANLNVPEGIAVDTQGRILVTNFGDGRLLRMSSNGGQLETLAMGLNGPTGVVFSPDGRVFFAELNAGQVSEVAADGSSRRVVARGLNTPDQMARAGNGLLYVTEFAAGRVTEVDPEMGATRVIASGLTNPVGVAVGPASASLTKTAQTPVGDAVFVTNNSGSQGQGGDLREIDSRTGDSIKRGDINNGAGCAAVQSREPVRVQFRQLNWLTRDGRVLAFSRILALKFFFSIHAATQLLQQNGGGYLNVVTQVSGGGDPQWSVRNLFFFYPTLAYMLGSCITAHFGLDIPNGTPVTEIMYGYTITFDPLPGQPQVPLQLMPVLPLDFQVGGRNNGGSDQAALPFNLGPWIGLQQPFREPLKFAFTAVPPGKLPRVEEDENGCAPGSVARSIKYMMDLRGIATPSAQDIYDSLVGDMESDVGPNGDGTTDSNMEGGKNAYTGSTNPPLPIESRRAYIDDEPDVIDEVLDILIERGDVELLISWDSDGDGDVDDDDSGGHAAMVAGVVCFGNGQCQIAFVDDNQAQAGAQNDTTVITMNPDGTFPGGRVDGFLLERADSAKVGAASFPSTTPFTRETATNPAAWFRLISLGSLFPATSFTVAIRQPIGINPSVAKRRPRAR